MHPRAQQRSETSSDDEEEKTHKKKSIECVEYILFCVLAECKSIVRKADLNKNVIKEHSRNFKPIFDMCRSYLLDVFGLELIDLDSAGKGDRFGIRSKFNYDSDLSKLDMCEKNKHLSVYTRDMASSHENDREFENQLKYTALIMSLSLIFMNGNEIDSQMFWEGMKRVGLNKDEKRHTYFGDVNRYFTVELVKEGYLE